MSSHDPRDGVAQVGEFFRQAGSVPQRGSLLGGPSRPPVDPRRHRRNRRIAAIVTASVIAIAVGLAAAYVGLTLNAPIGAAAATATVHRPEVTVPAAAVVSMPQEGESAISVSGLDDYLGASANMTVGGDAAVPIASISKLVTAMVVLSAKPLASPTTAGPTLTFDKDDHALYDKYYVLNATIAAMPTGSRMSEHDALETMLVPSATNYAEAVALWAFGSDAGYVSAARKWLAANGMTHTTMVEPTGIDARNTSTPGDMLTLGKLAMANPVIADIVSKTSLDVPGLDPVPNTNDLLGSNGVNGIKTGTLDSSGSDLLFSATLSVGMPNTVIGVVLSGYSHDSVDADVRTILNSLTAGFHQVDVATSGQTVGKYTTPWGSKASMVLASSAHLLTFSNTPVTSTMTAPKLKTGTNGEKVASVTYTAGKNTVTVPVVLSGTITPPTARWRLAHPHELLPWWP